MRTRVGDIFRIPIGDGCFGYGQIVASIKGAPPFIAIFERVSPKPDGEDLGTIANGPIALLANSFDSRIQSGDWQVIGNRVVDMSRIPFPPYKTSIGTIDEIYVISYDGTRDRKATNEEAERLDYRTSVAPIRLEKALAALHGLAKWEHDYERLRYEHVVEQAKISV